MVIFTVALERLSQVGFCSFALLSTPPPSPVWSTASALEELAFEHVGFPAESVRYLNMLRSDRDSFMGSGLEVPVTTGLLVLISGAASGNNLANIVQAVDSNKWPDEKRLIRVIKRTLEMVKTPAEYVRLVKSENSADVAACMRRELKDPYVPMPKFKIGRAKKKVNADSAEVAGTGGAFVAVTGAAEVAGAGGPFGDHPSSLDMDAGRWGRGGREPFGMGVGLSSFGVNTGRENLDDGYGGSPFDIDGGCGEFDFFGGGGSPGSFDGGDGGDGRDFFEGVGFSDSPRGSAARVGVVVSPFDVPAAAGSKGGEANPSLAPVPGDAAAAAGEERPLLGAVPGAAAAAGEERPLLDSPVGYVSQGGSSAAAGSGGASSSGVARGAAEFHFKVGDSVLVCGKPYMPFIDTQSFCGIVTGFSAKCGARG